MKFLKNIIAFTIPLLAVLVTFALYLSINSVVQSYKKSIINDYAIVIITGTPLIQDNVKSLANIDVKNIEILKREDILKNLKDKLSKNSLELLKKKLPFFYKIYLTDYPTKSQLKTIRNELQQIPNIKRIETFSSDHNKIYSLLVLCEKVVGMLFIFIFIFALLLLYKQIKIWFFEHNERISIIKYHGGSIYYSALPIIKIALFSSIFSSIITIVLISSVINNLNIFLMPEILEIIPNKETLSVDFIKIILMSFMISIMSIAGVLVKNKISND